MKTLRTRLKKKYPRYRRLTAKAAEGYREISRLESRLRSARRALEAAKARNAPHRDAAIQFFRTHYQEVLL